MVDIDFKEPCKENKYTQLVKCLTARHLENYGLFYLLVER